MQNQFDDFDAQLQCEDVQGDYIPTEQDLLDMEVAFALDPMEVVTQLDAIVEEFNARTVKYDPFPMPSWFSKYFKGL
jgi:hypothetical protein